MLQALHGESQVMHWREWNAHCDQWHADRARSSARRAATAQAIAYKLAHWRHRADEVCGRVWEDVC